ncbi:MAG: MFS transporter [Phycisphaerales bacterium]|nr:MFS transporter [Phycisphaerales bacterium]
MLTEKLSSKLERGRWYGWLFWGLAAVFYLYEFFIRVTPDAILPELGEAVNATGTDLVTSLSAYLWVYAPMQLVVGLLIDRFGSRFPLAIAALACGGGSLLFAGATGVVDLGFGRGLQGFGSAFAFVGAVYVATIWCAPKRLALIVGLTTSVGMIGSIVGQAPVADLAADLGWRPLVRWIGFTGLLLGIVLLIFIPSRPKWFNDHLGPEVEKSLLRDIARILLNWKLLLIGVVSAILYMPQSVIAALWGTTFLERSTGQSAMHSAELVSILPFTWLIACSACGWLSDRVGRRKGLLLVGTVGGGIGMGVLTFASDIGTGGIITALIIGGLFTSTQVLTFAVAMEVCPRSLRATAAALCNAVTMLAAAGIQISIAAVLEGNADPANAGNMLEHATAGDFRRAYAIIPLSFILAFVLLLFIPETGGQSQVKANEAAD